MTDAEAPAEPDVPTPSEPFPEGLETIFEVCALLHEKTGAIAEKVKIRRDQMLKDIKTLHMRVGSISERLKENKRMGPSRECKDLVSEAELFGRLLKVALIEDEFTVWRDRVMMSMSARRLVFEIESVIEEDKPAMVLGWAKATADLQALHDKLKAA